MDSGPPASEAVGGGVVSVKSQLAPLGRSLGQEDQRDEAEAHDGKSMKIVDVR